MALGITIPEKWFLRQKVMLQVCYGLSPCLLAAVYFFGWRVLAVLAVVTLAGFLSEAVFTFRENKPATSAVLVTCLIYTLSLPPTLPFHMAVIGIIVAVVFGKMAFGGFGRNVFNPAMVGRCFVYVCFPTQMTATWAVPFKGMFAGFTNWAPSFDALTGATPLNALKAGQGYGLKNLIIGNIAGSLGETSALLILLGGAYIIYKKAASWRLAMSCILGGISASTVLVATGFSQIASPASTLLSGSFLFGALFVVTEPISGAKTPAGQWIYGFSIGLLVVLLRGFSNFAEGIMFSVLLMNSVVPLIDRAVHGLQEKKRAAA